MRAVFFIASSPWSLWLPAGIIVPWAGKCLTELLLLYVTITRRVKYVWALALYTFSTTLILMVLAETRYRHYALADEIVSFGGSAMMLLVMLGLLRLFMEKGQREYRGIAIVFIFLCISQIIVAGIHRAIPPWAENLLGMGSWIMFMLWLTWECRWLPRVKMSDLSIGARVMKSITG